MPRLSAISSWMNSARTLSSPAHARGILVRRRRGLLEVHHVGNERRPDAPAQGELVLRGGVDDRVLHGRQAGRIGGAQVIPDAVVQEALALPEQVVGVGEGREG